MHIGNLSISGYRCFNKQFDISFSKGLNVIVGENGAGKTAVIDALRLQFSEDEYSRLPVQESDFHRPFESPGDISKKIEIKSIFQELNRVC